MKKIKTIEDQGEKQIKATGGNKKQLDNKQQDNNEFLLSKEREVFKDIYNKWLNKKMSYLKKNYYGNLKFIVDSTGLATNFSELKDTVAFLDSIKKHEILVGKARYKQKEFDRYFKKIRIANKSEEQKNYWLILICILTEETMLLNL